MAGRVGKIIVLLFLAGVLIFCFASLYFSVNSIKKSVLTTNSLPSVRLNKKVVDKVIINNKCQGFECVDYCLENKQECLKWCNQNPDVCHKVVSEINRVTDLNKYAEAS